MNRDVLGTGHPRENASSAPVSGARDGATPRAWGISLAGHGILFAALAWGLFHQSAVIPNAGLSMVIENPVLAPAKTPARAHPKISRQTPMVEKPLHEALPTSASLPVPVEPAKAAAKSGAGSALQGEGTGDPAPVAEFMVTAMPELDSEVRIPYPPGARQRSVQGPVVMELLIDDLGKVRKVSLVEGADPELSRAAVAAIKDFRFKPARVNEKKVAVLIRYTYRFVLDN